MFSILVNIYIWMCVMCSSDWWLVTGVRVCVYMSFGPLLVKLLDKFYILYAINCCLTLFWYKLQMENFFWKDWFMTTTQTRTIEWPRVSQHILYPLYYLFSIRDMMNLWIEEYLSRRANNCQLPNWTMSFFPFIENAPFNSFRFVSIYLFMMKKLFFFSNNNMFNVRVQIVPVEAHSFNRFVSQVSPHVSSIL